MTQKEFEGRTEITVEAEDFTAINNLYMNSDMDKDEFCEAFIKTGFDVSPVVRYLLMETGHNLGALEAERDILKKAMRQRNDDLADFLIGKAHAYDDTDFRNQAVKLVGETEVVKRTIELGLPLWDEDRKHILSMIDEQDKKIAG